MRLRVFVILAVVGVLGPACDRGPTPGDIEVSLVTPNTYDRAILFKVEADPSETVTAVNAECPGCLAFSYSVSDTEIYGVVTGVLTPGPLASISVSDVGVREAYALTVIEVAGQDHRLRSTTGYHLTFVR